MVVILEITISNIPPKYPAITPNTVPMINTIAVIPKLEKIEVVAPYSSRDKIQRPKLSVPNGYCSDGPCS